MAFTTAQRAIGRLEEEGFVALVGERGAIGYIAHEPSSTCWKSLFPARARASVSHD